MRVVRVLHLSLSAHGRRPSALNAHAEISASHILVAARLELRNPFVT
jgi:hypothetical protein